MKNCFLGDRRVSAGVAMLAGALAMVGCAREREVRWQGYLEGEFVRVAAPIGGRLEKLAVRRGDVVEAGTELFVLERAAELAARRQAEEQLRAAEARVADLRKGMRPSEIAALEARVEQAKAAEELTRLEAERLAELFRTKVIAENDYDRARIAREQAVRTREDLEAQLATARLGGRSDAIAAAEAEVSAAKAARERAEWSVVEKAQRAPAAALVYDTLYQEGEFVAAGAPVVSLLPPGNLKVRFFVPEAERARLKVGEVVRVTMSGREAVEATLRYLSPKPEYTPPVLYNRENRAKLVFMVEAEFEAGAAVELHPGQPVEVGR
jgi:Multidrug resistance efflux pump